MGQRQRLTQNRYSLSCFFRELIEAIVVLGAEAPCELTEEQKIPQLSSLARVLVEGYRQQARCGFLAAYEIEAQNNTRI